MENITCGYLEVILGPMFSGKTSKLVEVFKQYSFCNIEVLVVNHSDDIRYSANTMNTHDQISLKCIQTKTIRKIIDENIDKFTEKKPLAVLINEGQFFDDLYSCVYEMVEQHKAHVYVAGLDGDFKREKFGQMLDLIPICNKVYKLHSLCVSCKDGTKAIFSHRKSESIEQKIIGTNELYIPLCRQCYYNAKST